MVSLRERERGKEGTNPISEFHALGKYEARGSTTADPKDKGNINQETFTVPLVLVPLPA